MRILHLLNWKLSSIEKVLDYVKSQGFDTIQINPMQPFKESRNFFWWSVYQPLGFRIGNIFGDKEDLTRLCEKAKEKGISIIVDVVANHMANKSGRECLTPHKTVDKELTENKEFWKPRIMIKNGDNKYDACHGLIGLPGLDQSNYLLQLITLRYLEDLRKCGVAGFRFDAAKHIGLPSDGIDFFENVSKYLKENNLYAYGEFLGGNYKWRNELAKYMDVLTDPENKIRNKNKHVTFAESHDNYLNKDEYERRNLNKNDILVSYFNLCDEFDKTIAYPRPIDPLYSPYEEPKKTKDILNSNELDCFDDTFFTSKLVKCSNSLNEGKQLKLLKKSI